MFESMVTSSPVIMEMYEFKCKCISSLVVSDFSSEPWVQGSSLTASYV